MAQVPREGLNSFTLWLNEVTQRAREIPDGLKLQVQVEVMQLQARLATATRKIEDQRGAFDYCTDESNVVEFTNDVAAEFGHNVGNMKAYIKRYGKSIELKEKRLAVLTQLMDELSGSTQSITRSAYEDIQENIAQFEVAMTQLEKTFRSASGPVQGQVADTSIRKSNSRTFLSLYLR
jgi:conjugal transfer/entry exclusion protein